MNKHDLQRTTNRAAMDVQIRHDVPQTSGMRFRCVTTAQMMADAFTKVVGSSHRDHVLRGVFAKKTTEGKGTTNRAHHQSQETSAKGQYPNHACNKYYLLGIFCISPQFRRVRRLCRQWAPLHNNNMGSGIGLVEVWW